MPDFIQYERENPRLEPSESKEKIENIWKIYSLSFLLGYSLPSLRFDEPNKKQHTMC